MILPNQVVPFNNSEAPSCIGRVSLFFGDGVMHVVEGGSAVEVLDKLTQFVLQNPFWVSSWSIICH